MFRGSNNNNEEDKIAQIRKSVRDRGEERRREVMDNIDRMYNSYRDKQIQQGREIVQQEADKSSKKRYMDEFSQRRYVTLRVDEEVIGTREELNIPSAIRSREENPGSDLLQHNEYDNTYQVKDRLEDIFREMAARPSNESSSTVLEHSQSNIQIETYDDEWFKRQERNAGNRRKQMGHDYATYFDYLTSSPSTQSRPPSPTYYDSRKASPDTSRSNSPAGTNVHDLVYSTNSTQKKGSRGDHYR